MVNFCCVKGCKNEAYPGSLFSFHKFPKDEQRNLKWKEVVPGHITKCSVICSAHFKTEDYITTFTGGARKVLKPEAVPSIFPVESSECNHEPETSHNFEIRILNTDYENTLNACRVCLKTDGKLFSIVKYNLSKAFEELTGLSIQLEPQYPQQLCVECAHRLSSCAKFKHKAITAHKFMTDVLRATNQLKIEHLQLLHRESNELASNLTITRHPRHHYDLLIHEECADPLSEEQIKTENDNLRNDINENEQTSNSTEQIKNELFNDRDDSENEEINLNECNNINMETDSEKIKELVMTKGHKELVSDKKTKVKRKIKSGPTILKGKSVKCVKNRSNGDKKKNKSVNKDMLDTNMFKIIELTLEEQISEVEKRQNSHSYKNSAYGCKECYKVFFSEESLRTHMWKHTAAAGSAQCPVCKCHYKSARLVRSHVTASHARRYLCTRCTYATCSKGNALLHQKEHAGVKYKCDKCSDVFVHHTTYMGHLRRKHPTDIACQLCGYSFVSEKGVYLHKRLKHRGESLEVPEGGPNCEPCSIRFANTEALRCHEAVSPRHSGDKRRRNEPERRLGIKDGVIHCEQCNEELKSWQAYNHHFKSSHPDKNRTLFPPRKSAMCDQCGAIFPDSTHLTMHRRLHTGEKPYTCHTCGKRYRYKQVRDAHAESHKDAPDRRTYACDVCGKRFTSNSNRLRHQKFVHTALRPVECELCGKMFKSKPEKKLHVTHVHHNKPWPAKNKSQNKTTSN